MASRAAATVILWITYLAVIMLSMIVGNLGAWAILLAFVLMMPLIPITGMMWNWGDPETENQSKESMSEEEIEKRKRDRIDSVLRELSDEDLYHLRKRLSSGDVDDEQLYDMIVGDDGELVRRSSN